MQEKNRSTLHFTFQLEAVVVVVVVVMVVVDFVDDHDDRMKMRGRT